MTLRFEAYSPSLHDERYDDDFDDQDPHVATAATQAFMRLRALVNAGYIPDYDRSEGQMLLLSHPDRRFKYRDMLLDSSGTVWWRYDQDFEVHFARWEKKRFDGFLRKVPAPSWWDRTRIHRENIGAFVVGASICAALYFAAGAAMPHAYRYLGWS